MKTSSSSYRNRIDFIAAATLYCWHLWISKAGAAMEIRTQYFIRAFVSCVLPNRYVYKVCRNQVNSRKDLDLLYRDLECGQNIRIAKNLVYFTCGGYVAFPLTVVASIICSLIGWDIVISWKDGIISIVGVGMIAVAIGIGISKTARALGDSHIYLSYFKKFKKKDDEWHKKWKRYTLLLFIGSIASATIGTWIVFYSAMHT